MNSFEINFVNFLQILIKKETQYLQKSQKDPLHLLTSFNCGLAIHHRLLPPLFIPHCFRLITTTAAAVTSFWEIHTILSLSLSLSLCIGSSFSCSSKHTRNEHIWRRRRLGSLTWRSRHHGGLGVWNALRNLNRLEKELTGYFLFELLFSNFFFFGTLDFLMNL